MTAERFSRSDRFQAGWAALEALGVEPSEDSAGVSHPFYCCPVCRRGYFETQFEMNEQAGYQLTEEHAPAGIGEPRLLTCSECNGCASELFEDWERKVRTAQRKTRSGGGKGLLPYEVDGEIKFVLSTRSGEELIPVNRPDVSPDMLASDLIRDLGYRRNLKDAFHIATATLGYSFALCGRLNELALAIGCERGQTPGFPSVTWGLPDRYVPRVLEVVAPIRAVMVTGLPNETVVVLPVHSSPPDFSEASHRMLQNPQRIGLGDVHEWSDEMAMTWDHRGSPLACAQIPDLGMATSEERNAYDAKRRDVRISERQKRKG